MNRIPNYNYQNVSIEFSEGTFQEIRDKKAKSGKENTIFSFRSSYSYNKRSDIAIAILSKVFSSLEILVLKDRDMASGRDTTEKNRQLYLDNNSANHRVLTRWEIENYLYDKEVLLQYCLENELEFDENEYNNLVKDINNQNLKDLTGKIKNICGITFNVNPKEFKSNLSKCISKEMKVYQELISCIFDRS